MSDEEIKEQIDLLLDFYDLEIQDESPLKSLSEKLIGFVRKGRIEIVLTDGKPNIYQHLKLSYKNMTSPLQYGVLRGLNKLSMKDSSANDAYGRIYSLVGSLTGYTSGQIALLEGADHSVMECVGAFFMSV
jgi:hypothetical protein